MFEYIVTVIQNGIVRRRNCERAQLSLVALGIMMGQAEYKFGPVNAAYVTRRCIADGTETRYFTAV